MAKDITENDVLGKADGITTPETYKGPEPPKAKEEGSKELREASELEKMTAKYREECRKNSELKRQLTQKNTADPKIAELKKALQASQKNNRQLAKELAELKGDSSSEEE